jgi:hypothetical protein
MACHPKTGLSRWGYGVVGICYLVFVGSRLFKESSLASVSGGGS